MYRIWTPMFMILALAIGSVFIPAGHSVQATPSSSVPVGQSGDWKLLFSDDFDGAALDSTKWAPCFPWGTKDGCGSATTPELWYLPQNVIVSGGTVKLRAQRQNVTGTDGKTYKYTSGIITTSKLYDEETPYRFLFQNGYVEMRAKVPQGKGLWAAFWMLPPEGQWPPEIDVMEILGHDTDTVHMHYHYEDEYGRHRSSGGKWTGPDFADNWHTYAVSWEPGSIRWFVDGVERRTAFTDTRYIAAERMYLLLNLQVGGSWPGSPDSTTPFPSDYEIDYVRVWQRTSSEMPTTLIPRGSTWKYLDNGTDPGAAWTRISFDDALWASGRAKLGYGDPNNVTIVGYGPDPVTNTLQPTFSS
jgi:beta-glucanase (GH16 family)